MAIVVRYRRLEVAWARARGAFVPLTCALPRRPGRRLEHDGGARNAAGQRSGDTGPAEAHEHTVGER